MLFGVSQGSILDPFIKNIILNDIFDFVNPSSLYNYADDKITEPIRATIWPINDRGLFDRWRIDNQWSIWSPFRYVNWRMIGFCKFENCHWNKSNNHIEYFFT